MITLFETIPTDLLGYLIDRLPHDTNATFFYLSKTCF